MGNLESTMVTFMLYYPGVLLGTLPIQLRVCRMAIIPIIARACNRVLSPVMTWCLMENDLDSTL